LQFGPPPLFGGAIHPLTPLSAVEIQETAMIIRASFPGNRNLFFASISLLEPTKAELQKYTRACSDHFEQSQLLPRESFSVLLNRDTGKSYEARVNLNTRKLSLRMLGPGIQVPLRGGDSNIAFAVVEKNPEVRSRLKALGFSTLDKVSFDDW